MAVRRKFYALILISLSLFWFVMYKLSHQRAMDRTVTSLHEARLERLTREIELLKERLPRTSRQGLTTKSTDVLLTPHWVTRTCGEPVSNIAFLKMHKCASTTIQNILLRYGEKHNLTFAMPANGHIFPLHTPFEASLVHQNVSFHTDLVNIFAMHTKWSKKEVSKVLYPGAVYFTIVREPKSAFLSLYDFFAFTTYYKMNVSEFIMTHDIEMKRFMGCLSYNIMACDFGAEPGDYSNQQSIVKLTQQMDEDFDLVMVAERMEESLVLLAHLLCWSYDDVVAVTSNARSTKKISVNSEADAALSERLAPDYYIYNYFTKKFDELVKAFGEDRMAREVEKLRRTVDVKTRDCSIVRTKSTYTGKKEEAGSSKTDKVKALSSDPDCQAMVRLEQAFVARLKDRQTQLLRRP